MPVIGRRFAPIHWLHVATKTVMRLEPRRASHGFPATEQGEGIWDANRAERRRTFRNSLPRQDDGTDVMPNDVRRTDRSQRMPPDSLPEERSLEQDESGGGHGDR